MCELKASELRIGNYVYHNHSIGMKLPAEITQGSDIDMHHEFEPIPLTEEWLINFGFEKKSYFTQGIVIECVYYKLDNFVVYLLPNSFEVELINKSGDQFNLFKNWKHVHELQNVYFIFENKEITQQKK